MNSNRQGLALRKKASLSPSAVRHKTHKARSEDNTFVIIEDEDDIPVPPPIPTPAYFPKNSRFLGSFTQFKKFQEGNESFHPTYTGMYDGKKHYIKFNFDTGIKNGQKHHLISTPPELLQSAVSKSEAFLKAEILSQLEAACWMWYRIAAPEVVSKNVYPCFAYDEEDKKYQFVAVASEEIPGFRANRFDPLQKKDLCIDFLDDDLISKRQNLIENLEKLSPLLDRSNNPSAAYLSSLWNSTKQTYLSLSDSVYGTAKSAISLKPMIDTLLLKKEMTEEDIYQLLPLLIERQKKIETIDKSDPATLKKYQEEEKNLKKAIANASPDIRRLEEIDKTIDKIIIEQEQKLLSLHHKAEDEDIITTTFLEQTITISIKELKNHCLIDKINESVKISGIAANKPFTIKVKDIQNYRIKKGLAEGLIQSYINAENDYHNKNGSKKGKRIDFDMSEWPFFSKFKEMNFAEWLKNNAEWFLGNVSKFQFTQDDLDIFPNLKDDKRRYWPTEPTSFSQLSQSKLVIPFFDNLYTSNDNTVFRLLAKDPVFAFHGYKKFLQNILIPENMYRKSIELEIRYDLFYNDPNNYNVKKNLIDDVVSYKLSRTQQLKNMLYKAPQFHDFLIKNGDYAFSLIKKSFEKDKSDPDLKNMINVDEIKKEYEKVLIATGVKKDSPATRNNHEEKLTMSQKMQ